MKIGDLVAANSGLACAWTKRVFDDRYACITMNLGYISQDDVAIVIDLYVDPSHSLHVPECSGVWLYIMSCRFVCCVKSDDLRLL